MKMMKFSLLPVALAGIATLATSEAAFADNIYVSSNGDSSIEEISDGIVTQFVSDSPNLYGTTGLAFDSAGNLYVANNGITSGVGYVAEFNSQGVFQGDVATGLNNPRALAFDSSGDLFITNLAGGDLMEIPKGGTQVTVSDTLGFGSTGLTVDGTGNLYLTNPFTNTVDKITVSGGSATVTPFLTAGQNGPSGITYITSGEYQGDLAVVESGDEGVSIYNLAGDTVASSFIKTNAADGADFLTVDSSGDFYVTDNADQMVTEYGPNGTVVSVFKNTPGQSATFSGPCGIASQLVVPEPSTYALLLAGMGALYVLVRRKKTAV